MATSSITKQFVIKDQEVFDRLMHEVETKATTDLPSKPARSSLEKGKEALARFLPR